MGIYNICATEDTQKDYNIEKVIIHEMYYTNNPYYDIALLTLNGDTSFYQPICLPRIGEYLRKILYYEMRKLQIQIACLFKTLRVEKLTSRLFTPFAITCVIIPPSLFLYLFLSFLIFFRFEYILNIHREKEKNR